jgi:dTDP-4-amino-4,6-dideoxygalactose transaminase
MPRIFLSPPCVLGRERELLLDAFDSNWIAPLGPHVNAFEREFAAKLGDHFSAAALTSGTAAIHLALKVIGVQPGDEVLTSTFTFVASANAIKHLGATPVFIDSDWDTWNMDPNLLRDELVDCRRHGRRPAAVLAVDIIGQCCDFRAIREICNEFEIPLVEDAAEALGATLDGKPAGSFGDIACFSFNGNKIITASGGGMLVSDNAGYVNQARFLSTQARDPAPHYEHSQIGYNYRLSNLMAAVGRGQLEVLEEHVRRRRANFQLYTQLLGNLNGIEFMPEIAGGVSTRWLTVAMIDPSKFGRDRESIRIALEHAEIESRPAWKPMHQQPVYVDNRYRGRGVSDKIFETGLCLPSGSALTKEDIVEVSEIFQGIRS